MDVDDFELDYGDDEDVLSREDEHDDEYMDHEGDSILNSEEFNCNNRTGRITTEGTDHPSENRQLAVLNSTSDQATVQTPSKKAVSNEVRNEIFQKDSTPMRRNNNRSNSMHNRPWKKNLNRDKFTNNRNFGGPNSGRAPNAFQRGNQMQQVKPTFKPWIKDIPPLITTSTPVFPPSENRFDLQRLQERDRLILNQMIGPSSAAFGSNVAINQLRQQLDNRGMAFLEPRNSNQRSLVLSQNRSSDNSREIQKRPFPSVNVSAASLGNNQRTLQSAASPFPPRASTSPQNWNLSVVLKNSRFQFDQQPKTEVKNQNLVARNRSPRKRRRRSPNKNQRFGIANSPSSSQKSNGSSPRGLRQSNMQARKPKYNNNNNNNNNYYQNYNKPGFNDVRSISSSNISLKKVTNNYCQNRKNQTGWNQQQQPQNDAKEPDIIGLQDEIRAQSVPTLTPVEKALASEKKAARLIRFQDNADLKDRVEEQQNNTTIAVSPTKWGVSVAPDFLEEEFGEDYFRQLEEQKRKREEIMRNKEKRKYEPFFDDDLDQPPKKNSVQKEILLRKKNPFDDCNLDVKPFKQEPGAEDGKFPDSMLDKSARDESFNGRMFSIRPSSASFDGTSNDGTDRVRFIRTFSKSFEELKSRPVAGRVNPFDRSQHSAPNHNASVSYDASIPSSKNTDMLLQKTIYNMPSTSFHDSNSSLNHVVRPHERQETQSVLNGCILKVCNIPTGTTTEDILEMCSTVGEALEIKLNFPAENSCAVRFSDPVTADLFFKKYSGYKMGPLFLHIFII